MKVGVLGDNTPIYIKNEISTNISYEFINNDFKAIETCN